MLVPMTHLSAPAPVLTATGLTKHYGDVVALDSVSLALCGGTSTAVMGPSGSGKSTLLQALAGFTALDHGSVWLEGRRVDDLAEPAASQLRRRRYGFVFQSDQLLAELPAVENVALPLMLDGVGRRAATRRAVDWFEPLGIGGLEARRPAELSGGQLQRVAIARALVVGPAVVFADEPTAALDRVTGRAVVELLTATCRARDIALLVVTHDPVVAEACDRIVTMSDGRMLTHELVHQ